MQTVIVRSIVIGILATGAVALLIGAWPLHGEDMPTPSVEVAPLDDAHSRYGELLTAAVRADGVDYAAVIEKREHLDAYRAQLAATPMPEPRDAKMALLINAYNALTLALVIHLLPEDQSEWANWSVKRQSGFWTAYTFEVAGERMTLDHIEHDLLRPMGDPRIHMAVNCASRSCPKLAAQPYTSAALDQQLDQAAQDFVNSDYHVRLGDDELLVNQILDWFEDDFDVVGGVIAFIARHNQRPAISNYLAADDDWDTWSYDWTLNLASVQRSSE